MTKWRAARRRKKTVGTPHLYVLKLGTEHGNKSWNKSGNRKHPAQFTRSSLEKHMSPHKQTLTSFSRFTGIRAKSVHEKTFQDSLCRNRKAEGFTCGMTSWFKKNQCPLCIIICSPHTYSIVLNSRNVLVLPFICDTLQTESCVVRNTLQAYFF